MNECAHEERRDGTIEGLETTDEEMINQSVCPSTLTLFSHVKITGHFKAIFLNGINQFNRQACNH
jgi:hypothetical protein